jgi:anti-anti-sigma regulatory factor
MSITITYEASTNRLRLEGHSGPGDDERVREAIENVGREHPRTIVNLVAVTHIDSEIAELVVRARESARNEGREVALLRRAHSQVDRAITEAEAARTT